MYRAGNMEIMLLSSSYLGVREVSSESSIEGQVSCFHLSYSRKEEGPTFDKTCCMLCGEVSALVLRSISRDAMRHESLLHELAAVIRHQASMFVPAMLVVIAPNPRSAADGFSAAKWDLMNTQSKFVEGGSVHRLSSITQYKVCPGRGHSQIRSIWSSCFRFLFHGLAALRCTHAMLLNICPGLELNPFKVQRN